MSTRVPIIVRDACLTRGLASAGRSHVAVTSNGTDAINNLRRRPRNVMSAGIALA
ncbi:hypothetical protein [Cupriavidus campinensis]